MLVHAAKGNRVELCYRKSLRTCFLHHGKKGTVEIGGRGKPRNHLVRLDSGERIIVPCGHLNLVNA
jgi:hypothetical protein